jgi:hypothetical protein
MYVCMEPWTVECGVLCTALCRVRLTLPCAHSAIELWAYGYQILRMVLLPETLNTRYTRAYSVEHSVTYGYGTAQSGLR